MATVSNSASRIRHWVKAPVRVLILALAQNRIRDRPSGQVWDRVCKEVWYPIMDQVKTPVGNRVWGAWREVRLEK